MVNSLHEESCSLHPSAIVETAQEPLGGAISPSVETTAAPVPVRAVGAQPGARPWHVDLGWDGALTAVVDLMGHLVCECEPRRVHPEYAAAADREAEANARLIVEAVNQHAQREAVRLSSAVRMATVRETPCDD